MMNYYMIFMEKNMSELNIPESWSEVDFGTAINFKTGYAFKSSEFSESGVFVVRVTNINPKNSKIEKSDNRFISESLFQSKYQNFLLCENDILIVMVGASTGKIGLVGKEILPAVLNQNMWNLKPAAGLSQLFFFYFLKHLEKDVLSEASGSATGFIKQSDFKQRLIPVPPIKEQERIVQKIEACFSKIEETEQSLNKVEILLEKYRESLLAKAFRGELIPQNPDDEPASVLLAKIREERAQNQKGKKKEQEFSPISDEEKPFEIPENWEWVKLGELEYLEILSDIQDGNHGEVHPKASDYVKIGIPFVMANNLIDNKLALETCKFINKSQADSLRVGFAKTGDVLLTHKGTIGNCAIVPEIVDYIMLTPQVTYYRIGNKSAILNEFLYFVFQSPLFQNAMKSISKQATRDYVGITRQKDLIIPLPPISEQKCIVRLLDNSLLRLKKIQLQVMHKAEMTKVLRDSVLKKAFEGRLVEQIDSEGTGHELLQKILEQKNQTVSAKESTKKKVAKKVSKKKTTKK